MVYVNKYGTICQDPPLHEKFVRLIFGIFAFVVGFFKSLVGMDTRPQSNNGPSSNGSYFGGSSGGGSFGSGRPGGGPNIRTMRDINPPTVKGVGGCPGGSCGM